MARASLGMLCKFVEESQKFLICFWLITFQSVGIGQCLFCKIDSVTHRPMRLRKSLKLSPGSMAYVLP